MHDHRPKILFQNGSGYLAYCPMCAGFQLSYGTFYINQNLSDLQSLATLVNSYYHLHATRQDRRQRDIYIDSPWPGFGLLFCLHDLEHLNSMLQSGLLIHAAGDPVSRQ